MEALVAQKYRLRNIQDKQKEIMVTKELNLVLPSSTVEEGIC